MIILRTLAVLLGFVFALPLAWRLVPRPQTALEVILAGLGLSLGILSLGMFGLGLLCAGCVRLNVLLALELGTLASGLWFSRGAWRAVDWKALPGRAYAWLRGNPWHAAILAPLFVGIGLVFLSNAYYPFTEFDALARYAYQARLTFESRGLLPEIFGYPQLLPFSYAYAFLAFGGPVEWAARLTPSLMAAGVVGAVVALGRAWSDDWAGMLGALALVLTPIFARWATTGYVDVPVSFMITMAALALYRWWERKTVTRAMWSGLWMGLGLWTKQSAFLQLGGAGLFVGLTLLEDGGWRSRARWMATIRDGALILGVAALVAGPWYLRNYLLGGPGAVIPSPGAFATSRADPHLGNLIPFPAHPDQFGVGLGFAYALGLLVTLAVASGLPRRPSAEAWGMRLLACLTVPHMLIWWQRYSYNPRHLLTILPLIAVMAGYAVRLIFDAFVLRRWLPAAGGLLLVIGLAWPRGLRYYAFAPYHLALDPIGDVAARRYDVLGESYALVETIQREVPPGARIYTMDGRMNFYLSGYEVTSGNYPSQWRQVARFDYFVAAPWGTDVYHALGQADSPVLAALLAGDDSRLQIVERAGDFTLYRVVVDE